jgi:prefoldin subunit 5
MDMIKRADAIKAVNDNLAFSVKAQIIAAINAIPSHAEATEAALAVARKEIERLTREINGLKDALAEAASRINLLEHDLQYGE